MYPFDFPENIDRPMSILIVEDDLEAQAYLSHLLKGIDRELNVDRVMTAEEARALLDRAPPGGYDLVLADQFLKGSETGLDLWNYCRRKHPFMEFVLISGSEIDRYFSQFGTQALIPSFLKKPLNLATARRKLMTSVKAAKADHALKQILEIRSSSTPLDQLNPGSDGWRFHSYFGVGLAVYCLTLTICTAITWSQYGISLREIMKGVPAVETLIPAKAPDLKNTIPTEPIPLKQLKIRDPRSQHETGKLSV